MDIKFRDWLLTTLEEKEWSQADLARHAKVSRTAISDAISGKRNVGKDLGLALARALNVPPDEIFRAAGLLPPTKDSDDTLKRIDHLYHTLEDPANKQKALEFLEFLRTSEERGEHHAKKGKKS